MINQNNRKAAEPVRLDEWFEARAAQSPGCLALVGEGVSITYAELNRRANQLALSLRAKGVRPGAGGGLTERSVDLLTSVLGIWKARRPALAAAAAGIPARSSRARRRTEIFSHE